MSIRINPELQTILNAASTKYSQVRSLDASLTNVKKVQAKYAPLGTSQANIWNVGTMFRDADLGGNLTFNGSQIQGVGATSNVRTSLPVDLTQNVAVIRIIGNGHYLEGTLGLPGSGCDFIIPSNPTATNSIAFASNLSIMAQAAKPDGTPDTVVPIGSAITTTSIQNTSSSAASNVPFTFGMPFALGNLPAANAAVQLKLADNSAIPTQLDIKATHADGSVRHAVISGVLPSLAGSEVKTLSIMRVDGSNPPAYTPPTLSSYVTSGLDATVTITGADSVVYTCKLSNNTNSSKTIKWLTGNVANEWLITAPLLNSSSVEHPFLHVRFHVRPYVGTTRAKVDVVVENSWVTPDPNAVDGGSFWINTPPAASLQYSVSIVVPGDPGYTNAAATQYAYTRWARTFWWNGDPGAHVKHNVAYVISTRAVPNYIQGLTLNPALASSYLTKLNSNDDPGKVGVIYPSMGSTGGRADIGINPGWCVNWLLSGDATMAKVSKRSSQQSGNFTIHFRNKSTDLPVDTRQYPYVTLQQNPGLGYNGTTKRDETIVLPSSPTNPNVPEIDHTPQPSYIPYLLTGDFFHLEQMIAWNEYCQIEQNPAYRDYDKGGCFGTNVRGNGWMHRMVAQCAYLAPDTDSFKSKFVNALDYNLTRTVNLNVNATDAVGGNQLGFWIDPLGVDRTYQYTDANGLYTGIAPWMDDFFTQSIGMIDEMGINSKARQVLNWKAKFVVGRLTSGADFCWQCASNFTMFVRANGTSVPYTTFNQVYLNTFPSSVTSAQCGSSAMASALSAYRGGETVAVNSMVGYPDGDEGYPSNMQPAAAYVATSDHPQGQNAWLVFNSRVVKPVFDSPEFAIVPRT